MNREQRRRMAKQKMGVAISPTGEESYILTKSQLNEIVTNSIKAQRHELVNDITHRLTNLFMALCLDVLHSKFNFGGMRLKRFKYYMDGLSEQVEHEYCSEEDILNNLSEELDLDFMYRPVKLHEIFDDKHFGVDYEQLIEYPREGEKR